MKKNSICDKYIIGFILQTSLQETVIVMQLFECISEHLKQMCYFIMTWSVFFSALTTYQS